MSDPTYRSSRHRPRWLLQSCALSLVLAGWGALAYADAPNRRVPAAPPAAPAAAASDPKPAPPPPAPPIVVVAGSPPPVAPKPAKDANAPPPAAAPGPTTVVGPGAPPQAPAASPNAASPNAASPNAASPNAASPNAASPNDGHGPTPTVAVGSSFVPANLLSRHGNLTVKSFAHAKVVLRVLYDERRRTLYSDCAFDRERRIDYSQCSYRPRVANKRARRVEWEHVVPAEAFGRAFASWRQGDASCVDAEGRPFRGRRCAQRASDAYRHIEADLYNLYPEIGELNQLRSNKPMGEPRRQRRELAAPAATFIGQDAFTPRPAVRGDVARTYRYMHDAYPGLNIVSREREPLLDSWSQADPVDAWECRRAWRIEAIQGNENRFVKTPCLEAGLWPSG